MKVKVLPLAVLLLIIPSMVEGMKVKVLPLALLLNISWALLEPHWAAQVHGCL